MNEDIPLFTIGYETATPDRLHAALITAGVQLVVDVRALAGSRRPGFAKTKLAAGLQEAGIDYLHMPSLGTPADGRAAAKAGRHAEMHRIFHEHMRAPKAQQGLEDLEQIVTGGRRVCLLCLEANPEHCHRTLVAEALAERLPVTITHLMPEEPDEDDEDEADDGDDD